MTAFYVDINYFFLTPGLSLYPAVKIAVKNARHTPKIRAVFIYDPPFKSQASRRLHVSHTGFYPFFNRKTVSNEPLIKGCFSQNTY